MSEYPTTLDAQAAAWRAEFPGLYRMLGKHPLIYFDSANTAQKPLCVLSAVQGYLRDYAANVSRAVHTLSEEATAAYEATRDEAAALLNASDRREIVLTRGTTEGLNVVAHGLGQSVLRSGDRILVSTMEHHANLVPWQMVAERTGALVVPIAVTEGGELDLDDLRAQLAQGARVLALTHASNVLGTVNPVALACEWARSAGAISVIDGSQAVPHLPVDVQQLGCDFYAFTGHKLFAPTGTGVLFGRQERLSALPPMMGGGEMITSVSFSGTRYADPPQRFEAGTPNIAGHIGLAAAMRWWRSLDMHAVVQHESELLAAVLTGLRAVPGLRVLGHVGTGARVPVCAFTVQGAHPHDLALLMDQFGVALRSGQHCAHPLLQRFGLSATLRVSLALYNTRAEVAAFLQALDKSLRILRA